MSAITDVSHETLAVEVPEPIRPPKRSAPPAIAPAVSAPKLRGPHPGFVDLTGQAIARVVVLERAANRHDGTAQWKVRGTDCGHEFIVGGFSLRACAKRGGVARCPECRALRAKSVGPLRPPPLAPPGDEAEDDEELDGDRADLVDDQEDDEAPSSARPPVKPKAVNGAAAYAAAADRSPRPEAGFRGKLGLEAIRDGVWKRLAHAETDEQALNWARRMGGDCRGVDRKGTVVVTWRNGVRVGTA